MQEEHLNFLQYKSKKVRTYTYIYDIHMCTYMCVPCSRAVNISQAQFLLCAYTQEENRIDYTRVSIYISHFVFFLHAPHKTRKKNTPAHAHAMYIYMHNVYLKRWKIRNFRSAMIFNFPARAKFKNPDLRISCIYLYIYILLSCMYI